MKITKPKSGEYPSYCDKYFSLIDSDDLLAALEQSKKSTIEIMLSIPAIKENHSYAANKWSVKMVFNHIIDCERVYAYRALRFSRRDNTELQGFDEDQYALNANTEIRALHDIKEEFELVRASTISLYSYMSNEMLDFKGIANKVIFTPRSLGWMAVGHNIHHCNFVKKKYLR